METQEFIDDQIAPDSSQLNQEVGREEGSGSWNELEQKQEEDTSGEIEKHAENQGVVATEEEPDTDKEQEESTQKNTLEDVSRRVLSFKDFFERS